MKIMTFSKHKQGKERRRLLVFFFLTFVLYVYFGGSREGVEVPLIGVNWHSLFKPIV
jgi:hypothetical protein